MYKRVSEIDGWRIIYREEKRTLKNLDHGIKGRNFEMLYEISNYIAKTIIFVSCCVFISWLLLPPDLRNKKTREEFIKVGRIVRNVALINLALAIILKLI